MTTLIHTATRRVYELDTKAQRIRTLDGPARSDSVGWERFDHVSTPSIGHALVIVWHTRADGVTECSITSPVVKVVPSD